MRSKCDALPPVRDDLVVLPLIQRPPRNSGPTNGPHATVIPIPGSRKLHSSGGDAEYVMFWSTRTRVKTLMTQITTVLQP